MRVTVVAAGRLRRGPEAELVDGYLKRFDAQGRAAGLGPANLVEIVARGRLEGRALMAEEARLFSAAVGEARTVVLDERGDTPDSEDFAAMIGDTRDNGASALAFVIGGADGFEPAFRDAAWRRISFGRMTWPHMLARVQLAEQLYRAACILTAHPYHRRVD